MGGHAFSHHPGTNKAYDSVAFIHNFFPPEPILLKRVPQKYAKPFMHTELL